MCINMYCRAKHYNQEKKTHLLKEGVTTQSCDLIQFTGMGIIVIRCEVSCVSWRVTLACNSR